MFTFWKEIPFLRFFIFFAIGLLTARLYSIPFWWGVIALTTILLLLLYFYKKFHWVISVALLLLGNVVVPPHVSYSGPIGKVETSLLIQESFASGNSVASIHGSKTLVFCSGKNFYKSGEIISGQFTFTPIDSVPDSDWKKFLHQRKIELVVRSISITNRTWDGSIAGRYRRMCTTIRASFHQFLQSTIDGKNESDLMLSLLMGGTSHLDKDLKESFRGAGVMHIIAVSGMHLSLLFVVLAECIFFIKKNKNIDWTTMVISLSFIWLYSAATGFSSSVLRAAVMFTIQLVSEKLHRGYHAWNSYFLSAFILCFIFPDMLYDVGFHLSYLAVAGIFISRPLLEQIQFNKSKIQRYLYSSVVLSCSAQLLVTPYLLYFFQTFSPGFLLANLILVPLSSLLIYTGIVQLLGLVIPIVGVYMGVLNFYLLHFLITLSEDMSYSWQLKMDGVECILSYAVIASLLLFLYKKRKSFFLTGFALSALLMSYHVICFYYLEK